MLIITDQPEDCLSLKRSLSALGKCDLLPVGSRIELPSSRRMIVTDAPMDTRPQVEALTSVVRRYRTGRSPLLCLLKQTSARATFQANAIGATRTLQADAPADVILTAVQTLLQPKDILETEQQRQGQFLAAAAALGNILDAASLGRPFPAAALKAGVVAIDTLVDLSSLTEWLGVVRGHDDQSYQHSLLVAGLASTFSQQLGFASADRQLLTCAALLHDVGKSAIPPEILTKAGRLDDAEMAIMRSHAALGAELLMKQPNIVREVVAAARSHHEYLDGSGYPDGLSGSDISDIVRIITICDIFAALIERRSYKEPMPLEQAYEILIGMPTRLDMDLVHAFGALLPSRSSDEAIRASR